ncbi:hypothetical protein PYCCODRAFT_959207 [Trametes coccinea BRFM310]|uniref:Uncharacterized protein n=1 Tax=Trametes coccinea (strain BRFM310) TaxID=1353009 RepID=A0A1Y2IZV7_TRAC3|nr:hypothetical protein PYCCODRAFT_959207 [Trametes coccinea BRFM310]
MMNITTTHPCQGWDARPAACSGKAGAQVASMTRRWRDGTTVLAPASTVFVAAGPSLSSLTSLARSQSYLAAGALSTRRDLSLHPIDPESFVPTSPAAAQAHGLLQQGFFSCEVRTPGSRARHARLRAPVRVRSDPPGSPRASRVLVAAAPSMAMGGHGQAFRNRISAASSIPGAAALAPAFSLATMHRHIRHHGHPAFWEFLATPPPLACHLGIDALSRCGSAYDG